jgi:hypothetical protein
MFGTRNVESVTDAKLQAIGHTAELMISGCFAAVAYRDIAGVRRAIDLGTFPDRETAVWEVRDYNVNGPEASTYAAKPDTEPYLAVTFGDTEIGLIVEQTDGSWIAVGSDARYLGGFESPYHAARAVEVAHVAGLNRSLNDMLRNPAKYGRVVLPDESGRGSEYAFVVADPTFRADAI